MPIPEGGSRLVMGRGCHPTPILGQGHPRLHLLISSGSTVGCEAGRAAHIASLAAPGLGEGACGQMSASWACGLCAHVGVCVCVCHYLSVVLVSLACLLPGPGLPVGPHPLCL